MERGTVCHVMKIYGDIEAEGREVAARKGWVRGGEEVEVVGGERRGRGGKEEQNESHKEEEERKMQRNEYQRKAGGR